MRTLLIACLMLMAAPAIAQPAPVDARADMLKSLQKAMGKKNSPEAMGQMVVIGSLLGCTQKAAGTEATNAFYQSMKAAAKTAEDLCKQHQAAQARALMLSTFDKNKDNAVLKAALGCYDAQAMLIQSVGGPQMATDAATYANWARNPEAAKTQLKEADVCRQAPKAASKVGAL